MTGRRIVLIYDKSESYLKFEKSRVLEGWGEKSSVTVTSILDVGAPTLFGEPSVSNILVSSTQEIKNLTKDLEGLLDETDEKLDEMFRYGLVILSDGNKNTLKKLCTVVEKLGGSVVSSTTGKQEDRVDSLIKDLHVSSDVKFFIKDYAGQDYTIILSLVDSLSGLTEKQQKRVTVEDVFLRLPQSEGSVVPWAIEKPLLESYSPYDTIKTYRRIVQHSHPLVVLSLLKKKAMTFHTIAALLKESTDNNVIADALGMSASSWPYKNVVSKARKLGYEGCLFLLEKIGSMEADLKGASRADSNVIMESGLLEICTRLRKISEHS